MTDMSRDSLVESLHLSIGEAADRFESQGQHAAMARFLDTAAQDFGRRRPLVLIGTLTLVADQPNYPAPAGLMQVVGTDWGSAERAKYNRWDGRYPGPMPLLRVRTAAANLREIWLRPTPTTEQIACLTDQFVYTYHAVHSISDTAADTTITPEDRGLLLLRAQAEVAAELALRSINKPITVRDGVSGAPRNSTPAALARQLMTEFEKR